VAVGEPAPTAQDVVAGILRVVFVVGWLVMGPCSFARKSTHYLFTSELPSANPAPFLWEKAWSLGMRGWARVGALSRERALPQTPNT